MAKIYEFPNIKKEPLKVFTFNLDEVLSMIAELDIIQKEKYENMLARASVRNGKLCIKVELFP